MLDAPPRPALTTPDAADHPAPGRGGECLQCGAERVGPYCHACGQHESIGERLTFRSLWHDFRVRRLNLDRGLGRTLIDVVLRPGEVARAFVEGRRQTYTHPITLLFVLYAVYAVVFGILEEPFQEMMREGMAAGATLQGTNAEDLSPEAAAFAESITERLIQGMRFFYTYGAYFTALLIAPLALLLRWLLGDRGRNVAECAVFGAYVEAAVVIPSALVVTPLSVLTKSEAIGSLSLVLYLVYAAWGARTFFDRRPGTMALAVLCMVVALVVYFVFFAVGIGAWAFILGFAEAHAAAG